MRSTLLWLVITASACGATITPGADALSPSQHDLGAAPAVDLARATPEDLTAAPSVDLAMVAHPDLAAPQLIDDARVKSGHAPSALACGETATAQLTLTNTGTTTWTNSDGYKLGAVGDSDPFTSNTRILIPDGVGVLPGADYTFTGTLTAPMVAGTYVTDWQMVKEGVRWFGAITTQPISVTCTTPPAAAFDFNTTVIENSPSDIAAWPETAKITKLDFSSGGVFIDFTKRATSCGPAGGPAGVWPEVPFGDGSGNIEYTLWMVENINGTWYASGGIEYWCDDHYVLRNGGPPSGFGMNWFYAPDRWGPLANHQPMVGEQVGFLVSAGDARNNGQTLIKERSNVVFVPFPADTGATFNY